MAARHHTFGAQSLGMALVVVLWTIVVLAIMGSSFLSAMRTEMRMARNLHAATQARLLAEAGINRAIQELQQPNPALRLTADGTLHTLAVTEAHVQYGALDEAARIDLNKAPRELLSGLFTALGVEETLAARLTDSILDWRDTDSLRHLNGAEDGDYRAANLFYGAKDAPFDSVEELLLLPGMSHELFALLEPHLTVYSSQPGIDPALATIEVLRALPGMAPGQAEAYLQTRGELHDANRMPPAPALIHSRYLTTGRGLTYRIYASAELARGGAAALVATIRIQRTRPDQPVVILSWREVDARTPASAPSVREEAHI